MNQKIFLTKIFFWPQKVFDPTTCFYPKIFVTPKFFDQKYFLTQFFKKNYYFWPSYLAKIFWPKFFDYIFNCKNNLPTNQLGFDTIEINLVCFINKQKLLPILTTCARGLPRIFATYISCTIETTWVLIILCFR